MATVLEIVRGISQAMSNTHDGALDENGEPVKIGLRREEEVTINDKRVMDGFSVRFHGDMLCLYYNSETTMKEVHNKSFESDIEGVMSSIVSHLKKQYRKAVGETLSLKQEGETEIHVQNMSRVRSWLTAKQHFVVSSYEKSVDPVRGESKDSLEKSFKDWLRTGEEQGAGAKKNRADSRTAADKSAPDGNLIESVKVGDEVDVIGGALVGAVGNVIELTTTTTGKPAVVVALLRDADKKVFGQAGDEVIIQPHFVEPRTDLYAQSMGRKAQNPKRGPMKYYGVKDV